AAAEGLDVELVREVSWSNIRDKLNIGLFDAAHLLAPVAIASSLGIGHVKVPIVAPFGLGLNGNAITGSPPPFTAIPAVADGDIMDPMVSARALARVVAQRKAKGEEPLTFGMTFPFSTHNYHLRFWIWQRVASIPTRTCGWWCCRRPTWSRASPTNTSM